MHRSGFTLIELLVVVAIIGILATVSVVTLNPIELLRQSRDATRISDIATITNAMNLYTTDQSGASSFSLGIASDTYPSTYDPSATSTVGDQCQGLGFPALTTSAGQQWQCAESSTYRNVNNTGWIPVNLSKISEGSPIGSLPIDPTNQTSSGLFYSYNTNGTQFEVTADLESQRYKAQFAATLQTPYFPEVISGGTPTVSALYNPSNLSAWWPLTDGSGTIAYDQSGNGWNGTWGGTPPYYVSGGKVGSYAAYMTGNAAGTSFSNTSQPAFSVSLWVDPQQPCNWTNCYVVTDRVGTMTMWTIDKLQNNQILFAAGTSTLYATDTWSAWQQIAGTYNGSAISMYLNGALVGTMNASSVAPVADTMTIGGLGATQNISGYMNDVRVYNRVLSPAEVMAIYNAEK